MDIVIPAALARRRFAALLCEVERGRSHLITYRGEPVMRITMLA